MFSWLIIDGYNVINKYPELLKTKSSDIESAREKLLVLVQKYCDFKGVKATIVYDGRGAKRTHLKGNPEIIYSTGHETADSVIERLVCSSNSPEQIIVATDDAAERDFIKGAGAYCISVKQLEDEINQTLLNMRELL